MRKTAALGLACSVLVVALPAFGDDKTAAKPATAASASSPAAPAPAPGAAAPASAPGAAAPASPPGAPAPASDPSSLMPVVDHDPLEGGAPGDGKTPAPSPEPTPAPKASAPPHKPPAPAPEAEPIPPARDTVGGHLVVSAAAGVAFPFGSVDGAIAQSDVVGSGLFLGGDITYGISRTVTLGVYGEVATLSGEGLYAGKDASAIAAGPLLRYHLVQGTRFDPWLSYGIGFRRQRMNTDAVTGIDWARLQIGGDWYPASNLGIGPLLELSLGTFFSTTSGALESKSVNAQFVLGGRIVFDSPGK